MKLGTGCREGNEGTNAISKTNRNKKQRRNDKENHQRGEIKSEKCPLDMGIKMSLSDFRWEKAQ